MKERRKLRQRTYKAALAMALATGSLVTLSPPNALAADAKEKSFSDVQASQHFYEAVKNLTARGIISGYEDGTFRPSENISRAHAAKIMALALGLDTKNVKNPGFKDVSSSHPNYGAIAALVEAGVLKGYENNTFNPDGNLTRAQMAKMLVKGFKFEEEKYSNLPFDDVKNNEWHANYIQTLFANKITTGKTASKYEPNAYVTRGQAASFIYRTETTKKQEAIIIQNIANNELTVSDGTYAISKSFANILSESNLAVLKGSHIKYTVKDKEIESISDIEMQTSGNANNYLVLDGNGDKFNGELSTNGNFITIKNITLASLQIKQGTTSVTVDAKVEKLKVHSKTAQVTLGTNAKIGDLLLPAGAKAKDIIPNYDKVKANIAKINGVANPDAKPVTPPSSGGGYTSPGNGSESPGQNPVTETASTPIYSGKTTVTSGDIIELTVTKGNKVYYTLDGSNPTPASNAVEVKDGKVSIPVLGKGKVTLKAYAVLNGGKDSSVTTYELTVLEKDDETPILDVTGAAISSPPTKTTYQEGDMLDLTGLVITLTKSDESTEDVGYEDFAKKGITASKEHGSMLTTADSSVTFTHTLSNQSVEQPITVEAATVWVTGATISTPPTKTTYQEGDTLDLTGLVITLTKSDESTENVGYEDFAKKGITASKEHGSMLTTADSSVTFTHTLSNQSVEQPITVEAATVTVTGAAISSPPTKTTYQEGDTLDLTGLVITLTKSDESTENVGYEDFAAKGITVSKEHGSILTTADSSVTITHTLSNQSVEQAISVIPKSNANFELSLMHFNDTHAHLDNAAKRVTAVNEVRATKPNSLLLDAGDVFSGTLYFNEFKGLADLEFMNLMKVDAMTFGNHEFDLGSSPQGHKALADFIKAANFPFVSANVDFSKDSLFTGLFNTKIEEKPENANIYSGIVKEVNGEKIGIFGLTTAETKDISSPGNITFSNYIEDAKKMVAEFEKMGINKIVAITHIGYDDNPAVDNDMELAKAVEGIDIIVGGHSHTQLDKPVLVSKNAQPTIIVQAYQYADFLGTLDVTFDKNGVIVGHAGKLIKVADKAENPEAAEILKKYSSKIEAIKTEPTGATAVNALENPRMGDVLTNPSVRKNETPLGNLITDGMLNKAKEYNKDVVMAFQNGGGIREAINQGPITVGEVIAVLPFGNTLATIDLTGAEIKETFEISFKELPRENGGFLHVSGARVKYDSSKPVGQRVVSIAYKNADGTYTEIQNDKKYTVATNAFTAKGGDGYTVLAKAYADGRVTDLGLSDWENLREHLVSLVNVDPKVEGRIVDVKDEKPDNEYPGGDIPAKDFSGTPNAPKVYNGDVTVSVTNVAFLGNAIIKGNLIITGVSSNNMTLSNITVKGNLDLSGLNGETLDLDGIMVDGDTIL
ncbi:S-layer homology domain-containing protein [Psychrobacillus sp. BM2]|uniref:S-layer homology domain-containing protein n=1 Tax=Psychrobacillus sp. BM2 TaxID=3400421 RepID=UPI003B0151E2